MYEEGETKENYRMKSMIHMCVVKEESMRLLLWIAHYSKSVLSCK